MWLDEVREQMSKNIPVMQTSSRKSSRQKEINNSARVDVKFLRNALSFPAKYLAF